MGSDAEESRKTGNCFLVGPFFISKYKKRKKKKKKRKKLKRQGKCSHESIRTTKDIHNLQNRTKIYIPLIAFFSSIWRYRSLSARLLRTIMAERKRIVSRARTEQKSHCEDTDIYYIFGGGEGKDRDVILPTRPN